MIKASCSNCGKTFNAPDEYAGKKAKCPNCKQAIELPKIEEVSESILIESPKQHQQMKKTLVAAGGAVLFAFILGVVMNISVFSPSSSDNRGLQLENQLPSKKPAITKIDKSVDRTATTQVETEEKRIKYPLPEIPIYRSSEEAIVEGIRWRLTDAKDRGSILRASESQHSFSESKRTKGKFIEITMEVENLGTESIDYGFARIKLMDDRGRRFAPASGVSDWIPREKQRSRIWDLNPNMPVIFTEIYEVPRDATGLMVGGEKALIQLGF